MSQPLVVTIPHRLGRDEAIRRLHAGLGSVQPTFGMQLAQVEQTWTGVTCAFRASILGQATSGTIAVGENHVRIEVVLPWFLAQLAGRAKGLIEQQGHLMLEKK